MADEDEFDRRAPQRLIDWRLTKLEEAQDEMSGRIDLLATREDMRRVETKIDKAAQTHDERSFSWRQAIVAPIVTGVVVALLLYALLGQHPAAGATGPGSKTAVQLRPS